MVESTTPHDFADVQIRSRDDTPWSHPVAVFEYLRAHGPYPALLWMSPEGETIITAGEAARLSIETHAEWRAGLADAASAARKALLDSPARLFFSVYFDPEQPHAENWNSFAPVSLHCPRIMFVCEGDGMRVVTAHSNGDTLDEAALLAALREADGGPEPEGREPLSAFIDWQEVPFQIAVEQTVRTIRRGQAAKVVLARSIAVKAERDIETNRLLNALQISYSDCIIHAIAPNARECFISATPERLARVRDGVVRTAALAGTTPTGRTLMEEQQNRRLLQTNPKLWREHSLVSEMIHTALLTICDDVKLSNPEIVRLRNVQHLSTPISGRLKPGTSFTDVVLALHPTPAVCGTPRPKALEVIRRQEKTQRGLYAGAAGWMDAAGNGDSAVLIRSGLIRGAEAQLYAGAGILQESVVKTEMDETRVKLQPMLSALAVS